MERWGQAVLRDGLPLKEKGMMPRVLMGAGLLLGAAGLLAQQQPKKPPLSPPETASVSLGGTNVTITYSSPRVRGREGKIFTKDGLISHDPHYPVWRAGANAATTLETSGDLTIGDLEVPAGKYTLFIDLSDPEHWTLIVSKATGEWGLAYDPTKDLGRTPMLMAKSPVMMEDLTYTLTSQGGGKGMLGLTWEDMAAAVHIAAR
jgi:hypothetical protein